MEAKRVYGIDLGTTFSCIAYVDEASGRATVAYNAEGEATTPSVVLFEDRETRVVGREAKNGAVLYADRVVEMVKRQMGRPDWRFFFEDGEYSPEEVSSYILRKVAGDAELLLGTKVEDVVITCPAYFGISERDATAKAGEIAGLNVLEVINEPTAAAIAFGLHDDRDQVVLVYDLGGGTFDVTMIEIKGGSVTVVATGGDHALGGRDWDEEVVKYLARAWAQETGSTEDPLESEDTRQELWQRAEDAKRALTSRSESKVAVSHAGRRVGVTFTRAQFDELTRHLLERTVQYTADLLATARELGYPRFDQLLLVGGSTRMPQVAERLTREFGVEPTTHDPDQAVAKGAAVYGQKLAVRQQIRTAVAKEMKQSAADVDLDEVPETVVAEAKKTVAAELGMRLGVVDRLDRMKVTNVTSHSFGVVALDMRGPEPLEYISNLVMAQERLPASRTRTYYTAEAGQPHVDLRIMENSSRDDHVDIGDGQEIGVATLAMTAGLPQDSPVEVTFALGQDGRLHVSGRDMAHGGQVVEAVVETDRSLSKEELAEVKARSRGITVSG